MENKILALIGGSFKNTAAMGSTICKGDTLGIIRQFGTPIPILADCAGTVQWIRKDGVVRSKDELYKITAPDVLAVVMESVEIIDIPATSIAEAEAPPPPTDPEKKRAPRRRA